MLAKEMQEQFAKEEAEAERYRQMVEENMAVEKEIREAAAKEKQKK